MPRSCFEKLGNKKLLASFDKKVKDGIDPKQAAYEVVSDEYKAILRGLIKLKTKLKVDISKDKSMLENASKSLVSEYEEEVTIEDSIIEERPNYTVDKYDSKKTPSENKKGARDNMKIDIIMSVLNHPNTLPQLMNPGGYAKLKEQILPMITSKIARKSTGNELFYTETKIRVAIQNMAGKQMVGIAANHNAHNAIRQHANLTIAPILFNGIKNATSISITDPLEQYAYDAATGKIKKADVSLSITKNLAEFLAAVVDNAKDPLAGDINYNEITADMYSLIISAGFDTITASLFMSQPIVRAIISEKRSGKSMDEAIYSVNKAVFEAKIKEPKASNITVDEMFKALGTEELNTPLQKKVFNSFAVYSKVARDLGSLIAASKADTKGLGATLAAGEVLLSNIEQVTKKSTEGKFLIGGAVEFLNGTGNSRLVKMFTEYGVAKPINEILQDLFPYNSPFFSSVKQKIRDSKAGGFPLSEDQRNTINDHISNFMMSRFFDSTERPYFINQFPAAYFEYIAGHKELLENKLIRSLLFEGASQYQPYNRITFANTGSLTKEQQVDIQKAWAELFTDPTHSQLAHDLMKYSYFTSGLGFGARGFSHLAPIDAYLSYLKSTDGMPFADYMYASAQLSNDPVVVQEFFDQFMRNQWFNRAFVPQVGKNGSIETGKNGTYIMDGFSNPAIVISKGIYVPYAILDLGNQQMFVKFTGINGKGHAIYTPSETLGIKYYMNEYLLNGGSELKSDVSPEISKFQSTSGSSSKESYDESWGGYNMAEAEEAAEYIENGFNMDDVEAASEEAESGFNMVSEGTEYVENPDGTITQIISKSTTESAKTNQKNCE